MAVKSPQPRDSPKSHWPPTATAALLLPPTAYTFVECASKVKRILLRQKKITKVTSSKSSAFASSVLLRLIFTSNSAVFVSESIKILFAPGRRVPQLRHWLSFQNHVKLFLHLLLQLKEVLNLIKASKLFE